ncbi:4-aminobutyrate aminotransferase and related aminotransferases [Raoultella terrigena]|uniref:4-aminobutyrate aminotransferase and related aminotransferases n=1 Tax=Raoultella terrigena TaxID=577 RepID=A0A3P8KXV3_RAOTE|nr:4-aminobutyrate aminotransferase and related aminotransferases [Raoultella terrigena]
MPGATGTICVPDCTSWPRISRPSPTFAAPGCLNAVEFARPDGGEPDPQLTSRVIYHLKLEGVLIGAAGRFGNSLKIRPPLCFSRDDADFFLERLAKVMGRLNE